MTESGVNRLVGKTVSHYRVIAQLGAGGMGVVYRGEDTRLGRPVAIKFVADDFANDAQAVARLRAEARAASALNHPNITTIHDIGTEEGHPFIVMELMEGQPLRERLGRGPLKVHELVDLGVQIADALQAAHTAGIMHRDIKPANIFITGHGHAKLLDFGLAKQTTVHAPGSDSTTLGSGDLTAAGTTLGTVAYMSPEQATGDELDGRTDLFSLGVVLYECATGRQPFEGKTHAVILSAILNRAPVPPSTYNPDIPQRLQEVILTCLEKDRELRYQNAADLRADLKRVRRDLESGRLPVSGSSTAATAVIAADSASRVSSGQVAAASGASAPAPTPTAQTRPRTALVAGGVIALAALGAGGYALLRRPEPQTAPPQAAAPAPETRGAAEPADGTANRLALAQSNLAAGNYRAAQAYAAEVLASEPRQPDALKIRQESTAALERFDRALALARQRLSSNDIQAAARALADARDIDPTSPAVSELSAAIAQRVPALADASRSPRESSPPSVSATTARPQPSQPAPEPPAPAATSPLQQPPPAQTPPPAAVQPAAPPPPQVPAQTTTVPDTGSTARPPSTPTPAVPAPAVERPVPPPPPAPAPAADDEGAVRRVVAAYARAIETKDVGLFRSVKPNLSREEEQRLQEGFRAVTSQQVQLTVVSVEIRDQEAAAVAQRRDVIDAGGRRRTVESRQTFRLARNASGWVITDIR